MFRFLNGVFDLEKLQQLRRAYAATPYPFDPSYLDVVEAAEYLLGRLEIGDRIDDVYIDTDVNGLRCLFLTANFGNVGSGAITEVLPLIRRQQMQIVKAAQFACSPEGHKKNSGAMGELKKAVAAYNEAKASEEEVR